MKHSIQWRLVPRWGWKEVLRIWEQRVQVIRFNIRCTQLEPRFAEQPPFPTTSGRSVDIGLHLTRIRGMSNLAVLNLRSRYCFSAIPLILLSIVLNFVSHCIFNLNQDTWPFFCDIFKFRQIKTIKIETFIRLFLVTLNCLLTLIIKVACATSAKTQLFEEMYRST